MIEMFNTSNQILNWYIFSTRLHVFCFLHGMLQFHYNLYIHPFCCDHRFVTQLLVLSCIEMWVEYIFNGNYKPHKLAVGGPCMNYFDPKPI